MISNTTNMSNRDDNPNAETLSAIDDVDNNRNMSKTFDCVSALMEDLDA